MDIISELISIANSLDENKRYSEANEITNIAAHIREAQDNSNFGMDDQEHISDFGELEETEEEDSIEHESNISVIGNSSSLSEMMRLGISFNSIKYPGELSFLEFTVGEKVGGSKFRTLIVDDIYFNSNKNIHYVVIREKRHGDFNASPQKDFGKLWGVQENLKDKIHILPFYGNEVLPSG